MILSSPGDLKFPRSVDTIEKQAAALRKEGADVVVAVVHTDRAKDEVMIRNRVGRHHPERSRSRSLDQLRRAAPPRRNRATTRISSPASTSPSPCRRTKDAARCSGIRNSAPIDTRNVDAGRGDARRSSNNTKRKLSKQLDVPIATTAVELDSRNATVRTQEAAIGDLFADAMRAETDADIAITNGGGIRGGRIYPPGTTITRRDMMAELPFRNHDRAARYFGPRHPRAASKTASATCRARPAASRRCRG